MVENDHFPTRQALAPWLAYLIFTFCAIFFLFPFMRTLSLGSDEGTLLCGASRIVDGQVFARDFFEVMGPGTFYWLAAFFKLFGVSFLAARICLLSSLLGSGLVIYYLSRCTCMRYRILPPLILAATYFGMFGQGVSHHVDSNLFALLSIACLFLWLAKRGNSLLIAYGSLAGATTCVLQPKGILLFLAFLVWIWLQRRRIPSPLLSMALATGGYMGVIGLALVYFWSQRALHSLIYVNFEFPSQHYSSVNVVNYAFGVKEFWESWVGLGAGSGWSVVMASVLVVPFLFIAALPALLLMLSFRYKWKTVTPEILLLGLSGWACWFSEFHRKDIYHLVYGSPILIVLCIHMMTTNRRKLDILGIQILATCAVCLAAFNCLMVGTVPHASMTRAGAVTLFESDQTLKFLIDHITPGEEIFVYPYSPMYYFLSAATNPTPYSILLYNYNIPAQFQEVVTILEARKVKYVVWDIDFISKSSKKVFPGSQPVSPKEFILEPYLESHYTAVAKYGSIQVMERK